MVHSRHTYSLQLGHTSTPNELLFPLGNERGLNKWNLRYFEAMRDN
jgi:hypothetical protein